MAKEQKNKEYQSEKRENPLSLLGNAGYFINFARFLPVRYNNNMKKIANKKSVGILISLLFIAFILYQADMGKTLESFARMDPVIILPALFVYFMSFIVRTFRWKILLSEKNLKFSSMLSSVFIGFSLNCILPARAGEIYRAYFFSKKESLNKTKVFTSVILERFFDGLILFMMLIAIIYTIRCAAIFSKIAAITGLIFIGGAAFLAFLATTKDCGNKREKIRQFCLKLNAVSSVWVNKIFGIINSFFEGIKTLNSFQLLFQTVLLTFIIWVLEGTTIYLVIKSFGIDISYLGTFLVLTITAFSSLIPAGPAGIGPYQWGYIIALSVFNVETELALAVSITNQFLLILFILSIGLLFMWKDHISLDKKDIEDELNWS